MNKLWLDLTRAVDACEPACRVVVVDGPPSWLGTRLMLTAAGGRLVAVLGEGALVEALWELGRATLADGRERLAPLAEGIVAYAQPLLPPPHLVIAGAGHIARALAPVAQAAGFRVTVVDDRPAFAHSERFPGATVVTDDPVVAVRDLNAPFVVIANRSHELDRAVLHAALRSRALYIGLMGSHNKARAMLDGLDADLSRVHSPVGLELGAETPGEIAVAIAAELVSVRRASGIPFGEAETMQLCQTLDHCLHRGEPCALATVIESKGSTPRRSGASMLVRRDGHTAGTVGGSRQEAEIERAALAAIGDGQPRLYRADFTPAQGFMCGGAARVFIEPIIPR